MKNFVSVSAASEPQSSRDAKRPRERKPFWQFGETIPGYSIPVFNEREVRASAGILFLLGGLGYATVLFTGDIRPLQGFAMLFLIDMYVRVFVSPRLAPTLALGRLVVRWQRPEWVGAPQKRLAWSIGMGMALVSCASLGLLGLPIVFALSMCGLCLGILFLETAFGICLGCELYKLFARSKPLYCPGDSCNYRPSMRTGNS